MEFWCGGRRWRCTDVGTRVVVGVCLDPHEVVTLTREVGTGGTTTTQVIATDDSWFAGPPYAVLEEVFAVSRPMGTKSSPVRATGSRST